MRITKILGAAAIVATITLAAPAQAGGYFSFGFSTGGYYAPPPAVYYPPPVVYAPPVYYYGYRSWRPRYYAAPYGYRGYGKPYKYGGHGHYKSYGHNYNYGHRR